MAEDVIDIRKRIEEIRNEVSSAMESSEETVIQSRPAGELAEFSVPGYLGGNRHRAEGRAGPRRPGGADGGQDGTG